MNYRKETNIYDFLIIIIISLGCFGELFSPLTLQRIFALILAPWLLANLGRYYKFIPKFVSVFFAFWIILSIFSLVWSGDRINGVKYLLYNFCSIINFYSLFIFSLKAKRPIKSIYFGWIILFLCTFPIALWEIWSGSHLPISVQNESTAIINADGLQVARVFASVTYGNLNNYVLTSLYCLPFVIIANIISRKRHIPIMTLTGIIFILLINSSRGGLLCLGICLAVGFFYINKYKIISKSLLSMICILFFSLIVLNAGFLLNQIMGRLLENSLTNDDSRMEIYTRGIKIFTEYLFLGCGIGSLELNLDKLGHGRVAAMHNMFLEFLVQYGLLAFALFLRYLYKIIRPLVSSDNFGFKCLGVMIITCILPLNIINSGYLTSCIFWLFWASLLVYSSIAHITEVRSFKNRKYVN